MLKNKVSLIGALLLGGLSVNIAIPAFSANQVSQKGALKSNETLLAQAQKPITITLVSYAVTKAAYDKLIPKFVAQWKKQTGQDLTIKTSYGGSGSQTRAVIDGLEADVVQLALVQDIDKIQKAGLINPGWQLKEPYGAIVTHSLVAIATRPGNPKHIKGWKDLTNSNIKVITANPKISGGAKWNFLGLWTSVSKTGGNEAQAINYVTKVYADVPVLPKDSRESSDFFYKKGQGDVLLNYENEFILAKQKGETSEGYILPSPNISIDAPVAVVDKVVNKHGTKAVSEAFVKYLFSSEAQRIFAETGFRPVAPSVVKEYINKFPKVSNVYTVDSLGGWEAVQKKFFAEGAIFDQVLNKSR